MEWWNDGMMECWNDGIKEWLTDGMVEWWNDGMIEWWNNWLMGWWNDGMMKWWNDGMMKWCNDEIMEWWDDRILVFSSCFFHDLFMILRDTVYLRFAWFLLESHSAQYCIFHGNVTFHWPWLLSQGRAGPLSPGPAYTQPPPVVWTLNNLM